MLRSFTTPSATVRPAANKSLEDPSQKHSDFETWMQRTHAVAFTVDHLSPADDSEVTLKMEDKRHGSSERAYVV